MNYLKICLCLLCIVLLATSCKKDAEDLDSQVTNALVENTLNDQKNNNLTTSREEEENTENDETESDDSEDSDGEECDGEDHEENEEEEDGEDEEDGEEEDEENGEDEENDEGEGDVDNFEVSAVLTGTNESEKLQGFDSDDQVTGGGGADLFPFTLGTDVITDFNPAEDMIDVGDFARGEEGLSFLNSLAAIAANSIQETINGVSSLVIDVDGNLGNATTTIIGISIIDLNLNNVFFGLEDTSIPPLEFTHIAEFLVTYVNCDVVLFPAHDLSNHPIAGQTVSTGCD